MTYSLYLVSWLSVPNVPFSPDVGCDVPMCLLSLEQEEWKAWALPAVRLQRQDHQDVGRQHRHVSHDAGESAHLITGTCCTQLWKTPSRIFWGIFEKPVHQILLFLKPLPCAGEKMPCPFSLMSVCLCPSVLPSLPPRWVMTTGCGGSWCTRAAASS